MVNFYKLLQKCHVALRLPQKGYNLNELIQKYTNHNSTKKHAIHLKKFAILEWSFFRLPLVLRYCL